MIQKGDKPLWDVLAMARGKSPWGPGKKPDDATPAAGDPPPVEDGEVKEGEVKEAEPAAEAKQRNPWLPPVEEGEERRSARIDDILRQRRGSAPSGGGFPPLPGGERARVILPWVLAGSAVLLALSTSIQVLAEGESAVVTKLGRYSRTLGPGMHITLPWPIEVVRVRDATDGGTLNLPDKTGEMALLTRDGELIDLAFVVRWRIDDARRYSAALADPDATLRALASAEMRAGVAELPFDSLWKGARQAELQQRVAGRIQRALDAMGSGIKVDGVEVIRANPPGRLAELFKKQDKAREESDRVRKQAEEWADQTLANARSEATAFNRVYEQYRLAPEVIRKRMYYETMERVLRNNAQVVAGSSQPAPAKPGGQ